MECNCASIDQEQLKQTERKFGDKFKANFQSCSTSTHIASVRVCSCGRYSFASPDERKF